MAYNPFYNIENAELLGYEYAWINFIKNNIPPKEIIPRCILDSWYRCRDMGMNPLEPPEYTDAENRPISAKSATNLTTAADLMIHEMLKTVPGERMQLWLADAKGNIIQEYRKGNPIADSLYSFTCAESELGTNGIDMALRLKAPISVVGAQHYRQAYHNYATYAAPIMNAMGEPIAALEVLVLCEEMNDFMLSFTTMVATAIEEEMTLLTTNSRISKQNDEKQQILDLVSDGIVYTDSNLVITFVNGSFLDATGLKSETLIGKHVSVLETYPEMTELAASGNSLSESKITLRTNAGTRTYMIQKQTSAAYDPVNPDTIWTFKSIDEIRTLAAKASNANSAYFTFDDILGDSAPLREAIALAKKAAEFNTRVVIEGESGTGKELFAQSIHNAGSHFSGPFVAIDCGAIPRELIESELFGYEEGAFTGAKRGGKRGKFERADGGTLFLDEIENLPLDMQSKLLRVLQEQYITRIGGNKPIPIHTQVIAATNVDLRKEIEHGNFREDLYYRLDIMHINIPPLREHVEDIPKMTHAFIEHQKKRINSSLTGIDQAALNILMNYSWPGNVRQLNNTLERMMVMAEGPVLTIEQIPYEIRENTSTEPETAAFSINETRTLKEVEQEYVRSILVSNGGNIKKTAELLGISRATIYKYLKEDDE